MMMSKLFVQRLSTSSAGSRTGLSLYFLHSKLSSWVKEYVIGDYDARRTILEQSIWPMVQSRTLQSDPLGVHLSKEKGGAELAMQLRNDISKFKKDEKKQITVQNINDVDMYFQNWLQSVFCMDLLEIRRITFDSSASVLENVAREDTVQAVRTISELKKRFDDGRRCYGLFHYLTPHHPVAFIHVALTNNLAHSTRSLDEFKEEASPTHAMFYSVNSANAAFRGLNLAAHLIKLVVKELQVAKPTIKVFSTLSPIPNFVDWMTKIKDISIIPPSVLAELRSAQGVVGADQKSVINNDTDAWNLLVSQLSSRQPTWTDNQQLVDALKAPLLKLACMYITSTTVGKGGTVLALDPVANFHMRNGAEFHRILWMGNTRLQGLRQSAGMMVNYLYNLHSLEDNATRYGANNTSSKDIFLAIGDEVKSIIDRK